MKGKILHGGSFLQEQKIGKVAYVGHLAIILGIISIWIAPVLTGWFWTGAFLWGGFFCFLNARQCKRIHCTFTSPLYLLLGLVSLGKTLEFLTLSWWIIWGAFVLGTLIAVIPEWVMKKKYWQV